MKYSVAIITKDVGGAGSDWEEGEDFPDDPKKWIKPTFILMVMSADKLCFFIIFYLL